MKRFSWMVMGCAVISAAAACGDSGTGGGGSGGSGTTTTSSTTGTTATTSSTGSIPCGTETCTPTQFCNDTSGLCGAGPAAGLHCVDKGNVCSDGTEVCGCDGMVYQSQSCAGLAGEGIDAAGHCTPPTGMFACGPQFCSTGQYCVVESHPDDPSSATTYDCKPIPATCGSPPTCGCLDGCGSGPQPPPCTIDADGNPTQQGSTG